MHLNRLRLTGANQLVPGGQIDVTLPAAGPIVLRGTNGSGKSLVTSAIAAYLGSEAESREHCLSLSEAGASSLQVEFSHDQWAGQGSLDFASSERSSIWSRPTLGWSSSNGGSGIESGPEPDDDLLRAFQYHLVISGRLALDLSPASLKDLLQAVRRPHENELGTWNARLTDLIGADGQSGRLTAASSSLSEAERQLRYVDSLYAELEREKARQHELTLQLADLIATGEMLKAEHEELIKISALAQRALRVYNWIEEIRRSEQHVRESRERSKALAASLHALEERFRAAPPDLPELVQTYVAARDLESELRSQLDVMENDRRLAASALEITRREFESLTEPDLRSDRAREQALKSEIDSTDLALVNLQRGRIELIRQRDGIVDRIAKEFSHFAALSESQTRSLRACIELRLSPSAQDDIAGAILEDDARRRNARQAELRSEIKRKFPGFDALPPATPDLLRELSDRRRILATLNADADQLAKRREIAGARVKPTARITWSIAAALAGFAVGALAFGWDIGLFAAVLASGLTLLVFKYLHQGAEHKLDSVVSAQQMSESRLKETRERISKIEAQIAPLSEGHLDEAIQRYLDYNSVVAELQSLDNPDSDFESKKQSAFRRKMAEHEANLPPELVMISGEELRDQLREFDLLSVNLKSLEEALSDYAEGGNSAAEISLHEGRLAERKAELAEISVRISATVQEWRSARAILEARVKELEQSAAAAGSMRRISDELSLVRRQLEELTSASGDLLVSKDPAALKLEWNAQAAQRDELKRIESELGLVPSLDELSARESLLQEEFDEIKQRLQQLDPLYLMQGGVAEYAAKYARQVNTARESIELNDETIALAQEDLQKINIEQITTAIAREPGTESLKTRVNDARAELDSVERDVQTTRGLVDAVRTELNDLDRRFASDLAAAISGRVRQFTDGMFTETKITANGLSLLQSDGTERPIHRLSDGVADLVWIAARFAILDSMSHVEQSPVIWDEPFSRLDERRLHPVREAIAGLSAARQVILLTRDSRLQSWGNVLWLDERAGEPAMPVMSI